MRAQVYFFVNALRVWMCANWLLLWKIDWQALYDKFMAMCIMVKICDKFNTHMYAHFRTYEHSESETHCVLTCSIYTVWGLFFSTSICILCGCLHIFLFFCCYCSCLHFIFFYEMTPTLITRPVFTSAINTQFIFNVCKSSETVLFRVHLL